jgi:hypothetical protein
MSVKWLTSPCVLIITKSHSAKPRPELTFCNMPLPADLPQGVFGVIADFNICSRIARGSHLIRRSTAH